MYASAIVGENPLNPYYITRRKSVPSAAATIYPFLVLRSKGRHDGQLFGVMRRVNSRCAMLYLQAYFLDTERTSR